MIVCSLYESEFVVASVIAWVWGDKGLGLRIFVVTQRMRGEARIRCHLVLMEGRKDLRLVQIDGFFYCWVNSGTHDHSHRMEIPAGDL
jgi:hypothetical protein